MHYFALEAVEMNLKSPRAGTQWRSSPRPNSHENPSQFTRIEVNKRQKSSNCTVGINQQLKTNQCISTRWKLMGIEWRLISDEFACDVVTQVAYKYMASFYIVVLSSCYLFDVQCCIVVIGWFMRSVMQKYIVECDIMLRYIIRPPLTTSQFIY